jgi:hypothetical protein
MSLNRAIVLMCLGAACGGSSSTGDAGPGQGVTLTVDGTAVDLSATAGATHSNAPYLTDVSGRDSTSATNLTLELSAYPPVTGTYSCPTNGVGIIYSTSGAAAFYAGVNSAALTGSTPTSCTITVTSYSAAGAPLEGTFSGTLAQANVPGSTHVITNGHFNVTSP